MFGLVKALVGDSMPCVGCIRQRRSASTVFSVPCRLGTGAGEISVTQKPVRPADESVHFRSWGQRFGIAGRVWRKIAASFVAGSDQISSN